MYHCDKSHKFDSYQFESHFNLIATPYPQGNADQV